MIKLAGKTNYRLSRVPKSGKGIKWLIKKDGVGIPGQSYKTKREAEENARAVARNNKPSKLVIENEDGSVQDTVEYGTSTPSKARFSRGDKIVHPSGERDEIIRVRMNQGEPEYRVRQMDGKEVWIDEEDIDYAVDVNGATIQN